LEEAFEDPSREKDEYDEPNEDKEVVSVDGDASEPDEEFESFRGVLFGTGAGLLSSNSIGSDLELLIDFLIVSKRSEHLASIESRKLSLASM
jgi:hypothetical protein